MMQTASISSLPFAMGTKTDAAALQRSALRRMAAPSARRGCRRCCRAAGVQRLRDQATNGAEIAPIREGVSESHPHGRAVQ